MKQVAIFLPSRFSNVSVDLDNDGCGAREQVADWLAENLAHQEIDVHVFTNQLEPKHRRAVNPGYGEIHYVEQDMGAPMLINYEWDALVSFDFPNVASLPDIKKSVKKIVNVQTFYGIPPDGMADEEALELIDAFVYPSEWAARECSAANGIDPNKAVVIPYAADPRFFNPYQMKRNEAPRFLYANQAEHGLSQMLDMWPRIYEERPDATLTIACPVDEFVEQIQWSHHIQSEIALNIRDKIGQDGVRYIGRQGRDRLAQEMRHADALLYPCEPLAPSELGSLPIIQAIASGCVPIFNDRDALGELYGKMGFVSRPDFVEEVMGLVERGYSNALVASNPKTFGRDSDSVAQDWNEFLANS